MADNGTHWQSRIVAEGQERPDQLLANPRNWRVHPKSQQDALGRVLDKVGWVQRVIVNQRTGHVVDGHLRVAMAISRGEPTVPVQYVDLSEDEESLVLASLDWSAGLAVADEEMLGEILASIEMDGVDELLLDIAADFDIDLFGDEPADDPGPQVDRAEELREKWQTERGQVWEIGRHRLMCGDSTSAEELAVLMSGARADMCWTDPPYGVQYQGRGGDSIAGDITYTAIPLFFALLSEVLAERAWVYVCGGATNASLYTRMFEHYFRMTPRLIVWDKGATTMRHNGYHSAFELVFVGFTQGAGDWWFSDRAGEKSTDIWRVPRPSNDEREHLTEKPIELPLRAIGNSCPPGGIVFEPFAGSGSAFVAAEQTGRICYGMELDEGYTAVCLERLAGMGLEPRRVE